MSNLFLLLLLNWLAVPPSLVWRAVLGVRQALHRLSVGMGMAREEVVGLQEEEDGCGDSASIWRVVLPQVETRCCRCYTHVHLPCPQLLAGRDRGPNRLEQVHQFINLVSTVNFFCFILVSQSELSNFFLSRPV